MGTKMPSAKNETPLVIILSASWTLAGKSTSGDSNNVLSLDGERIFKGSQKEAGGSFYCSLKEKP